MPDGGTRSGESVLGWDPVRLGLLRSRAHDVLLDLTSLSGTVAFLHDVEPVLGDTDVVVISAAIRADNPEVRAAYLEGGHA